MTDALVAKTATISTCGAYRYKTATISTCGAYRYLLGRQWADGLLLPFCMLNPSTADAGVDDPTIRRCMSFARREGYSGIEVVNLFAFRATNPTNMRAATDPCGRKNHVFWKEVSRMAANHEVPIVCAWGASASRYDASLAKTIFHDQGARLVCLGRTKDGSPKHPLYVRADQPLLPYA